MLDKDMIKGALPPPGSTSKQQRPMARIMQVHGSTQNWEDFVFLEDGINGVKAKVSTGVGRSGHLEANQHLAASCGNITSQWRKRSGRGIRRATLSTARL